MGTAENPETTTVPKKQSTAAKKARAVQREAGGKHTALLAEQAVCGEQLDPFLQYPETCARAPHPHDEPHSEDRDFDAKAWRQRQAETWGGGGSTPRGPDPGRAGRGGRAGPGVGVRRDACRRGRRLRPVRQGLRGRGLSMQTERDVEAIARASGYEKHGTTFLGGSFTACTCPKEACGGVSSNRQRPYCPEHRREPAQLWHWAAECPAAPDPPGGSVSDKPRNPA